MGMVEELAVFLEQESVGQIDSSSATSHVRIFMNAVPEFPKGSTCVSLGVYETAGVPPMDTFAPALPQWENPRVQIVTRTTSPVSAVALPAAARKAIDGAWRALTQVSNQTIGSTAVGQSYYLRIKPAQSPFKMGVDGQGRTLFAVNFDVSRKIT